METRNKTYALAVGALVGLALQPAFANDQSRRYDTTAQTPAPVSDPAEPSRTARQTVDDVTITSKVKSSLIKDDLVKARHINVDTNRGVVKLSGKVASDAEAQQALALARQVGGVLEVQSNLTIGL